MHKNVLDYEPEMALFPGNDVLIFYRELAAFGSELKVPVLCEINEYLGSETAKCFSNHFPFVRLIKRHARKGSLLFCKQ